MKQILILIAVIAFILSLMWMYVLSVVHSVDRVDISTIEAMEYAYFNGQKDAVNGEIHIIAVAGTDSCYRWLDSPWKNKEQTVYKPDCNADKIYYR